MDIPVTGLLFCSEGPDGQHSHKLYITSIDGKPVHTHAFAGVTSFDVGHSHRYAGVTAPAPTGVPHVHEFNTETTFDDGHTHLICGVTGDAVPLPRGGHFHFFEGVTSVNGKTPHAHAYQGKTGDEEA